MGHRQVDANVDKAERRVAITFYQSRPTVRDCSRPIIALFEGGPICWRKAGRIRICTR